MQQRQYGHSGEANILIVDDCTDMQALLRRFLVPQFLVTAASTGGEALRMVADARPDLMLLDLSLGDMDGNEVCRQIKRRYEDTVAVIVVSARSSCSEQVEALAAGADDYMVKPVNQAELLSRIRTHLRLREALMKLAATRGKIQGSADSDVSRRIDDDRVLDTQEIAVFALAKVAESRDSDTGDHLVRMRAYAQILAEYLHRHGPYRREVDSQFLQDLYRSSPLHDIGKVGISDAILLKPDRLSPEEFEKMKQHTIIGANILEQAVSRSKSGGFLAMAASIARFHHERFDGSGYPAGLVGREIPLAARIVALADVYDALTSRRPYKPPYSADHAKKLIVPESGKHFDPVIVNAFLACYDDFLQVRREVADQMAVAEVAFA